MKIFIDKLTLKEIFISQIDWDDTTFRMTYNRPIPPLVQSIQGVGLQQRPILQKKDPLAGSANNDPITLQQRPILQKKDPERYRVISGYRRLLALLRIEEKSLFCHIASAEIEEKDLLLFNFHDNLDRGFNPVEQALVVKRLSIFMEEKELIQGILPLLGLPPKKEILARTLKLSEVSPIFLPALMQGRLFPEIIEIVLRQFHSTADLILALFIFFHWSFQKQKEFLVDLRELSHRQGQAVESFFSSLPLTELLTQTLGTPQQKGEALRKYFRNRLFPILRETEKTFEEKISSLNLDQRTRITPPPFFEGGQYGLEIKFSSPKELRESLIKIGQALEGGKFEELP